jgi:hypothetical protein
MSGLRRPALFRRGAVQPAERAQYHRPIPALRLRWFENNSPQRDLGSVWRDMMRIRIIRNRPLPGSLRPKPTVKRKKQPVVPL